MTVDKLVLPIVHRNGTSREALIDQRCAAGARVREALAALAEMAPNGRDYYPEPGRFELARAQHNRRAAALRWLLEELQAEAEALAEGDPA